MSRLNRYRYYPLPELRRLAASTIVRHRRRALAVIRRQIANNGTKRAYLTLAARLIPDRSNHCRWQALIVAGEFVLTEPEACWRLIASHGASEDPDLRTGVACVLLEHLLEHHFSEYFPRVKRLALDDRRFADTFLRCWQFGQAEEPGNAERFTDLAKRLKKSGLS